MRRHESVQSELCLGDREVHQQQYQYYIESDDIPFAKSTKAFVSADPLHKICSLALSA